MSILIDQCVPRKFLKLLQEWGYQASVVEDHIPHDSKDQLVLELAQKRSAVLLTVDTDFANILDYPPEQYGGIMVMRYKIAEEGALILTLKQVLEDLYPDKLKKSASNYYCTTLSHSLQ